MKAMRESSGVEQDIGANQRLSRRLVLARRSLLPFLLLAELIVFSLTSKEFLSVGNFLNIASNATEVALMAAGMTLIILMGGIDVSTGFALGTIAWTVAHLNGLHWNQYLILLIAVLIGTAIGFINGNLVATLKVPSIVATLGMSAILQALLFFLWNRRDIFSGPILKALSREGSILGLPSLLVFIVILYLVLHWITQNTVFGRSIYAIGSNREAASLAGVKSNLVRITCFMILGGIVGVAAATYVGRVGVVQASTGNELTLLSIAAVVVGGTSILGGEGSLLRTLGGVAFIAILQNGVVLAGVPPLWNGLMIGFVILLAVLLDGIILRLDTNLKRSRA